MSNVDERERERLALAPGERDGALQVALEGALIAEIGEPIECRALECASVANGFPRMVASIA
jgi:hypothetical protein